MGALRRCPRLGNVASAAGTTRVTARNVKPGTAAREVQAKKMVDTGIVGVDASPTSSHDRGAIHVELYVVGISNNKGQSSRKPQFTQSTFAAVVAEEPRSSMPSSDRVQSMSR